MLTSKPRPDTIWDVPTNRVPKRPGNTVKIQLKELCVAVPECWPLNLTSVAPDDKSPWLWYLPIQQFGHNNPSTVGAGTNKTCSKLLAFRSYVVGVPGSCREPDSYRSSCVQGIQFLFFTGAHSEVWAILSSTSLCADLCSRDFSIWLAEFLHRDVWPGVYQSPLNSLTPSPATGVPGVRDSLTSSLIQSCPIVFLSQVLMTEKREKNRRETRTTFLWRDVLEPDLNGEEERQSGCVAAAWFHAVNKSLAGGNYLSPVPPNPLVRLHLPYV